MDIELIQKWKKYGGYFDKYFKKIREDQRITIAKFRQN
jgi:hypothetical protein